MLILFLARTDLSYELLKLGFLLLNSNCFKILHIHVKTKYPFEVAFVIKKTKKTFRISRRISNNYDTTPVNRRFCSAKDAHKTSSCCFGMIGLAVDSK